ncbi:MAG TPA: FtsX-like permease family protein [Chloroflexota bacterium]|jgi:putative ABC transport system permease protein
MGIVISLLRLVLKRTFNNMNLVIFTIVGLVVTVSLVASVPLYADAIIEKLLRTRLDTPSQTNRPPGAIRIRHLEEKTTPSRFDQFKAIDEFVKSNAEWVMDIPLASLVRYQATDTHLLQGVGGTINTNPLASEAKYAYVAAMQDIEKHIRMVEGTGLPAGPSTDGEVPIILSIVASEELHMYPGERYWYIGGDQFKPLVVTLRVMGTWEATDPNNSTFWLYHPEVMYNTLFTTEPDLFTNVIPTLDNQVHEYSWYMVFDHNAIHSTNVDRVRGGLQFMETRVATAMPNTKIDLGPGDTLEEFSRRSFFLRILLFALSVPLLAVVLYYIGISLGMVIERQRSEIAVFKSRGASTLQIICLYFIEGIINGGIALLLGPFVGAGIAQLIGKTYGFLLFADRPPLPVTFTEQVFQYSLIAAVLAVLAGLIPAVGAARHTIISYKQDVARSTRAPLWQRFFVDVLLLAVAVYGYQTLKNRQSILTIGGAGDVFIDPLMLLIPSLFIFALALVFLRIFPLITAAAARISSWIGGASVLLALRQISRTPGAYSSLVLLLILTLALGAFSASAAHTMDRNFTERVRYDTPADLILYEAWDFDEAQNAFLEPPFSAHNVDGVQAAARVRTFTAKPNIGRGVQKDLQVLAVDRADFARISWWRKDFASRPLGALMNALSIHESAAVVDPAFMQEFQVGPGDTVTLAFNQNLVDFRIVESAAYFPTLYPDKGHFFITNLDYLNDQVGLAPYEVWLQIDPEARSRDIIDRIEENGVKVIRIKDSRTAINFGRLDPQRTGLFGVLSIGFMVAAILTVLGFFLYSFLSFQRRLLQMGILRAIGLSSPQLFVLLMFEQVFLILLGVAAGTGFGMWTSSLFIPFLQVSADQNGQVPRFVVETAWTDLQRIYIVLGIMLGFGLLIMSGLLRRMKVYQAVKLGEQA